jgi:hypothetical protein
MEGQKWAWIIVIKETTLKDLIENMALGSGKSM